MLNTMVIGGALLAATPQIMPTDRLATVRAALPEVASPQVQTVLRDEGTFWYDGPSIIPSYQDTVGDGSGLPIGARANSAGKPIIVPEGKKFFTDDGETWSFPFGNTAGLDEADNAYVADFLSLPVVSGSRLPVVYATVDNPGWEGLGLHRWLWQFPVGTIVGEVIFVKDAGGALYPTEVRSRTKEATGWAVNAFRPFPMATDLSNAVKRLRPNWQNVQNLSRLVAHVENPATLESKTVTSPGFNDVVTLTGYLDVLPDFGDDELVKELLHTTVFASASGAVWKAQGTHLSFAPSTYAAFSIVPRRSFAGLIEVSNESCNRCHSMTSKMLQDFEDATILYGDMWGQDKIFSFHPWDPSRYVIFNSENRQVRPEFRTSGFVERYDAARHLSQYYQRIP